MILWVGTAWMKVQKATAVKTGLTSKKSWTWLKLCRIAMQQYLATPGVDKLNTCLCIHGIVYHACSDYFAIVVNSGLSCITNVFLSSFFHFSLLSHPPSLSSSCLSASITVWVSQSYHCSLFYLALFKLNGNKVISLLQLKRDERMNCNHPQWSSCFLPCSLQQASWAILICIIKIYKW